MKKIKRFLRSNTTSITFSLMVLFFLCAYIVQVVHEKSLSEHYAFSSGEIYNTARSGNGSGGSLSYSYFINRKYKGNYTISRDFPSGDIDEFLGKRFPIAYDTTNLKNSKMLIQPKDFAEFNLNFPDTLKWIMAYY